MANDRSKIFFNVLALENILVALTREIGDGPCFLYIKFSWIGVRPKEEFQNDITWIHLVTYPASWHDSLIFSLVKRCLLTNQNVMFEV